MSRGIISRSVQCKLCPHTETEVIYLSVKEIFFNLCWFVVRIAPKAK